MRGSDTSGSASAAFRTRERPCGQALPSGHGGGLLTEGQALPWGRGIGSASAAFWARGRAVGGSASAALGTRAHERFAGQM